MSHFKKKEDTTGIDIAQLAVCAGICNFNSLVYEELRDVLCMELLLVK